MDPSIRVWRESSLAAGDDEGSGGLASLVIGPGPPDALEAWSTGSSAPRGCRRADPVLETPLRLVRRGCAAKACFLGSGRCPRIAVSVPTLKRRVRGERRSARHPVAVPGLPRAGAFATRATGSVGPDAGPEPFSCRFLVREHDGQLDRRDSFSARSASRGPYALLSGLQAACPGFHSIIGKPVLIAVRSVFEVLWRRPTEGRGRLGGCLRLREVLRVEGLPTVGLRWFRFAHSVRIADR